MQIFTNFSIYSLIFTISTLSIQQYTILRRIYLKLFWFYPLITLMHPCVILQVYEQLYETLEIVGGPEVRAQATAKVLLRKQLLTNFNISRKKHQQCTYIVTVSLIYMQMFRFVSQKLTHYITNLHQSKTVKEHLSSLCLLSS